MQIEKSAEILKAAIDKFNPTHIVSMVSGGKDSAASDQVARELGANIDMVIHGNTRCGIPQTSQFVRETYGKLGDFAEADAGTAYEDYVLRKGFFGKGIGAHGFAYRILKATPFRKTISHYIRKGKRDVRVLLLNGARKDESENRQKNLQVWRQDPAQAAFSCRSCRPPHTTTTANWKANGAICLSVASQRPARTCRRDF